MPRLLLLCEYPTLLGGERSMLSTLPHVQASGVETVVACPPSGPLAARLNRDGVRTIACEVRPRSSPAERRARLSRMIDVARPDLLHANSLSMSRLSGPVASRLGIPSLGHLRDILRLTPSAVKDLNCHTLLVAVSHATRDHHVAQGVRADRCVVLHNGIDLQEYVPRAPTGYLQRELGLTRDVRLVVTVGQIGLRKGIDVALDAFQSVARRVEGVHWLVVGERNSDKQESRDLELRLRASASARPLAGRVHFLGLREDIPQLLVECELLLHAAHQEPLGRVLLEAAACGLPVVATEVGGAREIFPSDADGAILVPPGDRALLAEAMFTMLIDPQRRRALSSGGRRRALAAFDIEKNAAALIDCYRRVLQRP